ncbi:MAG: cryptochrome/photolyase family protein [Bacteroidia bacterium]
MAKTLRLILGDQLNINHSWFKNTDDNVVYCLFEMRQETDYVKHHIQKIASFFLAMRQFAHELKSKNHQVIYYKINDSRNKQSLNENLLQILNRDNFTCFEYQLPDEYRLDKQLNEFCKQLSIKTGFTDTEHFLSERMEVKQLFEHKKQILLETFYRNMRRKHGILLEPNGEPVGGKWNYDSENRKKYTGKDSIPNPFLFNNNAKDVINEIKKSGCNFFGTDKDSVIWPVSRNQALLALDNFVQNKLTHFGTYQDAMTSKHDFLFHSLLSFALNIKLLHPLEVIQAAVNFYNNNKQSVSLSQIEGFVRQILGWREYMRGIYWWKMPEYETLNFFEHKTPLPVYYWTANTKMNCLKQCITNSLNNAYAHHIQRLMVTGNFALLAGVNPDEVDQWYLGIYIDAIQWVEITNTRGMSQFADGGIVGSKPYISSANYIDKMSDYCSDCYYDKQKKYGNKACPFNSLYWHFYIRHSDKLGNNNRIGMMYNIINKMQPDEKAKILQQAEHYLQNLNSL